MSDFLMLNSLGSKIMASAGIFNATNEKIVYSKWPKETCKFTWKIADFAEMLKCSEIVNKVSIEFEMGSTIGFPVKLRAYLAQEENKKDNKKYVATRFNAVDPATEIIMLMAEVTVENYKRGKYETIRNVAEKAWGWQLFPEDETISKLPLDSAGNLPIDVRVSLFKVPDTKAKISNLVLKFQDRFLQTTAQNMENLYKNPDDFPTSSVQIKVVSKDGREFQAKSDILATRSPVFQSMFQTPMSELREGVVNIEDIGGNALDVFLHFMHTGILRDNWKDPDILEELAYAAHKYLMQDLLDFLDEAIGLVFSEDNCAKMIRLAHRLDLKKAEKSLRHSFLAQMKKVDDYGKMMELFQE